MPGELLLGGGILLGVALLLGGFAGAWSIRSGDLEDLEEDLATERARVEAEKRAHAESRERFARVLHLALTNSAFRESAAGLRLEDGAGDVGDLREWLRLHAPGDASANGSDLQGPALRAPQAGELAADPGLG